jgi:alpha-methylacyl-CoA racemase
MGPLTGLRIIELAGIGPGPFAAMMLADHGAEVIRIDRPVPTPGADTDILLRSRKSIVLDLKKPEAVSVLRDLVKNADGLIEGYRPGVMERLGIGPEVLLKDNPKLIFGRMTGWGQFGPYAHAAGHDLNYIALSGNLHSYGRAGDKPTPPVNAIGDFAGGGMMLAFGILAALLAVRNGEKGQVIDCAMTDGAAVIAAMTWTNFGQGRWSDQRGTNLLDTGAPFYDTHETADGKWISIGSLEPQFYAELRRLTGLDVDPAFDPQMDPRQWPQLSDKLTALFLTKTRDEWCALLEMTDVCFAPVLSLAEAPSHPHNAARGTFTSAFGMTQPMPAPRYSVSETVAPQAPRRAGADSDTLLAGLGYDASKINSLREAGAFGK